MSEQKLAGAYLTTSRSADLLIATAAPAATAQSVEAIFTPVAYAQHLPLQVQDASERRRLLGADLTRLLIWLGIALAGLSAASLTERRRRRHRRHEARLSAGVDTELEESAVAA